jgi:hypothetical protein
MNSDRPEIQRKLELAEVTGRWTGVGMGYKIDSAGSLDETVFESVYKYINS